MEPGAISPVHIAWIDALARIGRAILFALSIDPAKVISDVMSGVGLLSAGALFGERDIVAGTGSAASIWSAGAIGLICGMGLLRLAGYIALGIMRCSCSAAASLIPALIRPALPTTMRTS